MDIAVEDFACQCDIESDNVSGKSSDSSKKNAKSLHTLRKCSNSGCLSSISQSEDTADYYFRRLKETEETICHKNLIIGMLQEQLQKLEKFYRKSLDETQQIRYKYCFTVQELNNLKNIFNKYEEDNKKLSKEINKLEKHETENNEKEVEELQSEAQKWKQQYEELLNKIKNMEYETTKMKELLNAKDEETTTMERLYNGEEMVSYNTETLKEQYNDISNALKIQNDKLEVILNSIKKDDLQYLVDTTQGDVIEISIEAKKLTKTSESLQELSSEKLLPDCSSFKDELEKISHHIDCNLVYNNNNTLGELEKYKKMLSSMKDENDKIKKELLDQEELREENRKLKEIISHHADSLEVESTGEYKGKESLVTDSVLKAYRERYLEYKNAVYPSSSPENEDMYMVCEHKNKISITAPAMKMFNMPQEETSYNSSISKEMLPLDFEERINEMEEALLDKSKTIDELTQQCKIHIGTIEEISEQNDQLVKDYNELYDKYTKVCREMGERLSEMNLSAEKYRRTSVELEESLSFLKSQNEEYRIEIESLKLKLASQIDNECDIAKYLDQIKELKDRENGLNQDLGELTAKVESHNAKEEQHRKEIQFKDEECVQLRQMSESLKDEVETINKELQLRDDECVQLRKLSEDLKDQIEVLSKVKDATEVQADINQNALASVTADYNKLKIEMKACELAKDEASQLKEEKAQLARDIDIFKEINFELASKLESCKCEEYCIELECVKGECKKEKDKNRELQNELKETCELEHLLAFAEEKLTNCENEVKIMESTIQEKTDMLKITEKQRDDCKSKLNDLKRDVDKLTEENQHLKGAVKDLSQNETKKMSKYSSTQTACICDSKTTQTNIDLSSSTTVESSDMKCNTSSQNSAKASCSPRHLDAEELVIKRRYLLNRINSIDDKLNLLIADASKFQDILQSSNSENTPTKSPPETLNQIKAKQIVYNKLKNQKMSPSLRQKRKNDSSSSESDSCLNCSNTCTQKRSQLSWKMYSSNCLCQDKMRWQKSFHVVKTMRKEMDQMNKSLVRRNVGIDERFSSQACRTYDFGSSRKNNFEGIIYLKKSRSKMADTTGTRTSLSPCSYSSSLCGRSSFDSQKQQALLEQLNLIQKAIKENTKEEKALLKKYQTLNEDSQKRLKGRVQKEQSSSSDDSERSSSSTSGIPPQPFIKIECCPTCDELPNTLFINTYYNEDKNVQDKKNASPGKCGSSKKEPRS